MGYLNKDEISLLQSFFRKYLLDTSEGKRKDGEDKKYSEVLTKAINIVKEEPYIENATEAEIKILKVVRNLANIPLEHSDDQELKKLGDIHPDDLDKGFELLAHFYVLPGDIIERRNIWTSGIFAKNLSPGQKKILKELWRCFCLHRDPSVLVLSHAVLDITIIDFYTKILSIDEWKFNQLRNAENDARKKKRDPTLLSELMFASHGLEKRGIFTITEVQTIDNIRRKRNDFVHEGIFDLKESGIIEFVDTTLKILEKLHEGQ